MIMKYFRRHIKVFMLILIIAFVVWEIGTALVMRQTSKLKYAGVMFGKNVALQDFQRAYQAAYHRALMQYGDEARKKVPFATLHDEAWDRLLMLEAARRAHLQVRDREVIDEIALYPFFQRNNAFDTASYDYVTRHVFGVTPHDFEEEVRDTLKIRKLFAARNKALALTDAQLQERYYKERTAYTIRAALFSYRQYEELLKPTDEQLANYYQANKERYATGPRLDLRYVTLRYDDFASQVSVEPAEITEYYAAHKEELSPKAAPDAKAPAPEANAKTASAPSAPDEQTAAAIKKRLLRDKERAIVEDALQRIYVAGLSGVSFEEAIKKAGLSYKETKGLIRDQMVPEVGYSYNFAQAAFMLKTGETSTPVMDQDAGYLIKLMKSHASSFKPFEEIKDMVRQHFVQAEAKKLTAQEADQLAKSLVSVRTEGDFSAKVSAAAKELKTYGPFKKSDYIPEVGSAAAIADILYGYKENEAVPVALQAEAGYLVAYITAKKLPDAQAFDKEKEAYRNNTVQKIVFEDYFTYYSELKKKADLKSFVANTAQLAR